MTPNMDPGLQNIINNARNMISNGENRPLMRSPHFGTSRENEYRFQVPSARPEPFLGGSEYRFQPGPARSESYGFNNHQPFPSNNYSEQEQQNDFRTRVSLPQRSLRLQESMGGNHFEVIRDLRGQPSFGRPMQTPFYQNSSLDRGLPITPTKITPPRQPPHFSSPSMVNSSPTDRLSALRPHYSRSLPYQPIPSPKGPALRKSTDPPTANGIQLISTNELADRFRQVFSFELFNAVQSKCFPSVYQTAENIVVSAPTGSGKTAIMELAICRLVGDQNSGQFKIVYQAPTKSLCAERVRDWRKKFSHLNLQCAELTGDTEAAEMRKVGNATIIVTTPEKWDSITRKWKDYIKLLQMVKLFLIDEVHILKDARGATLEAVVSRMKSIGAQVRFVALSATVPNSDDIAVWLGRDSTYGNLPACRETFGEEFRPVKLQKHVYGFDGNSNGFAFDTTLENKLLAIVEKHTHGKPIMVFCFTRKSCESTAAKLSQWWASKHALPAPTQKVNVISKELAPLVVTGVAFHHAGLDVQDRNAVEAAFLSGQIKVICCTSTLAVGVNLPCHLVIIKGTVGYTDAGLAEYSDLEIMQMLGRAGRPQFDDSAVAVIMTRNENVDRYTKMISGQEVLESTLHLNLIEHLNSEIVLGTVYDVTSAKKWLSGTFLSVRMQRNPHYYKFGDSDERLERDIAMLQDTKLVTGRLESTEYGRAESSTEYGARLNNTEHGDARLKITGDGDGSLKCTEYGETMARYMIQFETMKSLLTIPRGAKIGHMLHIICQAAEFKDLRIKANERGVFRDLNKSPLVRFPIKENVSTTPHKVSLIIQVQLGGVELPSEVNRRQYVSEKGVLFDRIHRLVKCVVDCKVADGDGTGTLNALELSRSIAAGYWENMPVQLRQIHNFGAAATAKLIQGGVNSVLQLCSMDGASIERIMSRNPPFGPKILDQLKSFPRLTLEIVRDVKRGVKGDVRRGGVGTRQPGAKEVKATWKGTIKEAVSFVATSGDELVHIWRGKGDREIRFVADGPITCTLACDRIVGTIKTICFGDKHGEQYMYSEPWDSDSHNDVDDFVDIDEVHQTRKWRCNHSCSGQTLKNGQLCKHECCHEGLDKPRKAKKGLSFGAAPRDELETIDLLDESDSDIGLPLRGTSTGKLTDEKPTKRNVWTRDEHAAGKEDDFAFDLDIASLDKPPELPKKGLNLAEAHRHNVETVNLVMDDFDFVDSDLAFPFPGEPAEKDLGPGETRQLELGTDGVPGEDGSLAFDSDIGSFFADDGLALDSKINPIDDSATIAVPPSSGKNSAIADAVSLSMKRAASPMESNRKTPIWLDEIDADIVAQFAGLVEFVD